MQIKLWSWVRLQPAPSAQVKADKPVWWLSVIAGAVLRTLGWVAGRSTAYLAYLQRGQLPPAQLTLTSYTTSLVLDGAFYLAASKLCCVGCGAQAEPADRVMILHALIGPPATRPRAACSADLSCTTTLVLDGEFKLLQLG